jgi:hypothetical protein
MMAAVSAAWVMGVMNAMQPSAASPWWQSYGETATAIAAAANDHNLYPDEVEGPKLTASILLGIAFCESRFNPTAMGQKQSDGQAIGLFGIKPATAKQPANMLLLPLTAAPIALTLIKTSFRICNAFPWNEQLGWYAAGGNGCKPEGRDVSRPRLLLAEKIMTDHGY